MDADKSVSISQPLKSYDLENRGRRQGEKIHKPYLSSFQITKGQMKPVKKFGIHSYKHTIDNTILSVLLTVGAGPEE